MNTDLFLNNLLKSLIKSLTEMEEISERILPPAAEQSHIVLVALRMGKFEVNVWDESARFKREIKECLSLISTSSVISSIDS